MVSLMLEARCFSIDLERKGTRQREKQRHGRRAKIEVHHFENGCARYQLHVFSSFSAEASYVPLDDFRLAEVVRFHWERSGVRIGLAVGRHRSGDGHSSR